MVSDLKGRKVVRKAGNFCLGCRVQIESGNSEVWPFGQVKKLRYRKSFWIPEPFILKIRYKNVELFSRKRTFA